MSRRTQSKPRKRMKRSEYLDDMAVEGDEESESDYEFRNEREYAIKLESEQRPRISYIEQMDAKKIAEKYDRMVVDEVESSFPDDLKHINRQQLLPGVKDPKLWLVGCKRGKERQAVVNLLQKVLWYQQQGQPLLVFSAFASNHMQEHIYIEAHREAHVKIALRGSNILYENRVKLVPNEEMTDVFNMDKVKPLNIGPGSLVRIKIGDYKGDLAQILDIEDQRGKVTVKIVPRLEKTGNKRGAQKLFNPADFPECEKKRDSNLHGEMYYLYRNQQFVAGFLVKQMSLKSIITEGLNPSISELQYFQQSQQDNDTALHPTMQRKEIKFVQGDRVIVTKGDVAGLTGLVKTIFDKTAQIQPDAPNLRGKLYDFPVQDLTKFYLQGEHVKVVAGRHIGKTGMVMGSEGNVANIITDISKDIIQVLFNDLVYSEEVSTGIVAEHNFRVNDIVTLSNERGFGIVVKADNEYVRAIMDSGDPRNIWLHEIGKRIPPAHGVGNDREGNSLSTGDMVKITYKQHPKYEKCGSIKNALRGTLFLFFADAPGTDKIYPVKSVYTILLGASMEGQLLHSADFIGNLVKIIQGPYRGLSGKIIDLQNRKATVELSSNAKKVTLDIEALTSIQSAAEGMGVQSQQELQQSAPSPWVTTPAYRDISSPWPETPSHEPFRDLYTRSPSMHRR